MLPSVRRRRRLSNRVRVGPTKEWFVSLQPSAPAHRLVDLVEFLARHPDEEFTVSELSRRAGLNRTTCTSILLALESRGWVQPRGAAGYALGSGLIPIGESALASLRLADEVQPELDRLVVDLGMEALASVASSHELVVVAHAHTGSVLANTVRVGLTIPFVPPFGIAHLVHTDTGRVDAWLDRSPVLLSDADRSGFRQAVAIAEQRGCVVVLDLESRRRFERVNVELGQRPASRAARRRRDPLVAAVVRDEQALGPWSGSEKSEVSQISAPVFGPDGRPALAIGLHGLPHQIDPAKIPEYTTRVMAAAARVTERIHGDAPVGTLAGWTS
jgi:DNA-binding IclR family transcriptional regulator